MLDLLRAVLDSRDEPDRGGGPDAVDELTDAANPTEFSHELYVDATELAAALAECSPADAEAVGPSPGVDRSLEVGCGYGRLTPWIAAHAVDDHAVDLDGCLLSAAAEMHRVVAPDGALVVSEATDGTPDPRWEYRSVAEWRDLFAPRELVARRDTERDEVQFGDPDREHVVMTFR
ncbi:hypothetical protein BRC81_01440 [Halobacteriales archaeon QS_1_68_20]|nr:MAG: hypothetical protein BRC81_01440 [Halobacteriales archaeon QS_1_68_20]